VLQYFTADSHTFYKLAGGRGSCKSSFAGTETPLGIMRDAAAGKFTRDEADWNGIPPV
jgi:hypothetical protein